MLTILYVDDEPDLREIVAASLQLDDEIQVETSPCAEDALSRIALSAPDLLMLDVMMPGMDGTALLARLRADPASCAIPVLFITAKVQPSETERLMALGSIGVIQKPFDPRTLAATIKSLWRGSRPGIEPMTGLEEVQARLSEKFRHEAAGVAEILGAASDHAGSLLSLVHSLAGTAGTLGFFEIGEVAGDTEMAIEAGGNVDALVTRLIGLLKAIAPP